MIYLDAVENKILVLEKLCRIVMEAYNAHHFSAKNRLKNKISDDTIVIPNDTICGQKGTKRDRDISL